MQKLTQQEEEVLRAVFKVGSGNVKSIMQQMDTEAPYTTIASTIKNLEKKGYLGSTMVGNTYIYASFISQEEYKKKFVGSVVKQYFSDSYKEVVSFLVKQKKVSAEELKEIIQMIEKEK